jgi:hypothetical protein
MALHLRSCGTPPRVRARRESLYQTGLPTSKRQSGVRGKTLKISAQILFLVPVAGVATARAWPEYGHLTRRIPVAFMETIGQHFRRAWVSRHFRSMERAKPHRMGAGAIAGFAIAAPSTGGR